MKSTRVRILIIGAAVILAVTAALAQGWHGHGGPGGFGHMFRQLDLTTDQRAQIKAIWTQEKPTLQPLMQQARQNRSAMNDLVASGPFDEGKVTALATQNVQTLIQLQVERAKIRSEMMQTLTPAQKTKLAQIEADRAARMSKHAPPPPEE